MNITAQDLQISAYETNKSKIKTNTAMDLGYIPKHAASVLIVGRSGSGKTNLLIKLLTEKFFYKDYFDLIFLFSATAAAGLDDMYEKNLNIPKKHIFAPDQDGLNQLKHIAKTQKAIVKEKGLDKAPKILLLFDDVAHAKKFLASKEYLLFHTANRHYNTTVFSLMQYYVKMPKACRCQVKAIMFFHGCSDTEKARLAEEHLPTNHSEKEFMQIINHAIRDKFNFLFINKDLPMRERHKKNLDTVLMLSK